MLSEQNKNISKKGTIAIAKTDVVSDNNLYYGKTAEGLLCINGALGIFADTASGTTLATLPEDCRPSVAKWLAGLCVYGDNAVEGVRILIGTDGTIKAYQSSSAQRYTIIIDSAVLIGK